MGPFVDGKAGTHDRGMAEPNVPMKLPAPERPQGQEMLEAERAADLAEIARIVAEDTQEPRRLAAIDLQLVRSGRGGGGAGELAPLARR